MEFTVLWPEKLDAYYGEKKAIIDFIIIILRTAYGERMVCGGFERNRFLYRFFFWGGFFFS